MEVRNKQRERECEDETNIIEKRVKERENQRRGVKSLIKMHHHQIQM